MIKKISILLAITVLMVTSCQEKPDAENNEAVQYIADTKQEFAPDKRVALFDIEAEKLEDHYILKGESNLPEAVKKLKTTLDNQGIKYTDSIKMLPEDNFKDKHGIVNISVANLRSNPAHSAELATQATLGMPLKVYKIQGDWFYVQTPDGYLAWVDKGGIVVKTSKEFLSWKAAKKLIYLNPFGNSYEQSAAASQVVSDLVAGDIFEIVGEKNGYFEVQYPDFRKAFIKKEEAKLYNNWLNSLEQKEDNLVATSKQLMGLPYLWGGTSPKGVDCSGYTKTIFFLNGMIIPRDASQQVHTGTLIDSTKNFEKLLPGDLLFFGRTATDSTTERVVHVGMWIGDNKFIHSSGKVHISSVDSTSKDYDEFNYNRYLRTKRILKNEGEGLLYLSKEDIFSNRNAN